MFREGIPSKQLSAWLAAAAIPTLIQIMSGSPWVWTLIASIGSGAAVWLVWHFGVWKYPKWVNIVQMLFVAVLLGDLLKKSGAGWPTGHQTAVPLILLALAVWSAQKGPSAAARVGGVLFWFIILMYLIVFGAGVKDIRVEWLKPKLSGWEWTGVVLLILPAGAAVLVQPIKRWGIRLVLPLIFVLVASLITSGVLSPEAAARADNPFYELSQSLNLFGIAKRFEAVISTAMTVGWFTLISLLLTLCGKYFEESFTKKGKAGVWIGALMSAVWMLCGLHIPEWFLPGCAAVFWVTVPILTQGIGKEKKS